MAGFVVDPARIEMLGLDCGIGAAMCPDALEALSCSNEPSPATEEKAKGLADIASSEDARAT
jgi:hypothetical protein